MTRKRNTPTYRRIILLEEDARLMLQDLPFSKGQKVEVVITPVPEETATDALDMLLRHPLGVANFKAPSKDEIHDKAWDEPTLSELLAKVTKENLHKSIDFGSPRGTEAW